MNKYEFKKLKKQLDKLLKKDQTFIIKLIDKIYLVRGQELTEIDIIPEDLKVYEVDATDRNFFYFFTKDNGEPVFTTIETVSESIRKGDLDGME